MTQAVATGVLVGSIPTNLTVEIDRPPWLECAEPLACLGNADLFFPPDYTATFKDRIEAARVLCDDCPVKDLCLDWAVAQPDLDGIWASTTPPDRRRLRKKRKAA